jgi:hypothetical protein
VSDRIDLGAGIASTVCHLALLAAAWLASWQPVPEQPAPPEAQRELIPAPELLPRETRAAPMVLPPEAAMTKAVPAEAPDETELPPLDAAALDFEPQAQRFSELPPAELGTGEDEEAGQHVDLPSASTLEELRSAHRQGQDQAAAVERAERQVGEARHVFAGWLRTRWRDHWAARYDARLRNRDLRLLVTVDARHQVRSVEFLDGHGTGLPELDTLIQLHIAEQARQGNPWGLPPLPNRDEATYLFPVRLPR